MSGVDLDRLIVRQMYFIPITSSDLKDAILKELCEFKTPAYGLKSWTVIEEHAHGFVYKYDYMHQSVISDLLKETEEPTPNRVQQEVKKYKKELPKSMFDAISQMKGGVPVTVDVLILEKQKEGCLCNIECLPNLYNAIFQAGIKDVKDIEIQEAYRYCKRFLERILRGGLYASLVEEEKKQLPELVTHFLINDQTSHQIRGRINEMLDQATSEVLICGWIGTILLPKLKDIKQKGINIRMMTHKSTELKGKPGRQDVERAHAELVSMLGKENISMSPECHFRVLVVDNKALVGSMDFNAISLTGTHREFAIYTEIPEIVRSIRNYFNQIFTPLSE